MLERVRFGIIAGLLLAGFTSAFVVLASLARGSAYYTRYDLSLWQILGGYLLAALVAGAVFGLIQPLARTRAGATIVGMLVGTFAYGAIGMAVLGWAEFSVWFGVVPGVLVGGLVGFMVRKTVKARSAAV